MSCHPSQIKASRTYYLKNKKQTQRATDCKISCAQKKATQNYLIKKGKEVTCTILHLHHEEMKDDPEHLTTEFMQEIIGIKCNTSALSESDQPHLKDSMQANKQLMQELAEK